MKRNDSFRKQKDFHYPMRNETQFVQKVLKYFDLNKFWRAPPGIFLYNSLVKTLFIWFYGIWNVEQTQKPKSARKLEILLCAAVSAARHQPWLEKSCTVYSRFGNMLKIPPPPPKEPFLLNLHCLRQICWQIEFNVLTRQTKCG